MPTECSATTQSAPRPEEQSRERELVGWRVRGRRVREPLATHWEQVQIATKPPIGSALGETANCAPEEQSGKSVESSRQALEVRSVREGIARFITWHTDEKRFPRRHQSGSPSRRRLFETRIVAMSTPHTLSLCQCSRHVARSGSLSISLSLWAMAGAAAGSRTPPPPPDQQQTGSRLAADRQQ